MCSGPCSKTILLLLNGFFLLCGAGLLGIGLWMKLDPMFSHYLHVVNVAASNPFIDTAAFIFIAVGGAAFIIAFIGCCGAIRESQCLIFMYIVLLFLLIAGEIVAAVLALLYRSEVESKLEAEMKEQLYHDYLPTNNQTYEAWNYLQSQLKCCGVSGYGDYKDSAWWNATRKENPVENIVKQVPDSCCVPSETDSTKPEDWKQCQTDAATGQNESKALYTHGCHDELILWFKDHSLIMMCLGFGIAAVQILGFVAACCFRRAMKTSETYEK